MELPIRNNEQDTNQQPKSDDNLFSKSWEWVFEQSTFIRIHLVAFIFIPLLVSGIFYASNGRFHIRYLDALFLCYSAMTGTGLATLNLSTLTPFQQVLLYILMGAGTQTTVSWCMVLTRRYYIRSRCTYLYWQQRPRTREELINAIISSPRNARIAEEENGMGPDIAIIRPTPAPTPNISRAATVTDEKDALPEEQNILGTDFVSSSPKLLYGDLPEADPETHSNNKWNNIASPTSMDSIRQRRAISFHDLSDPPVRPRRRGMTVSSYQSLPFTSSVPGIDKKYQGTFGLPSAFQILDKVVRHFLPKTYKKFERSLTIQTTTTIDIGGKIIASGRNSNFRTDTIPDDQLEEVGGVEYRAVNLLCYLIPIYFIAVQLITFLIFAPSLSATKTYNAIFEAQPRFVSKSWYSLFLVMSAYSGTGLDLCDTAMLPFQEAYLMIFGIMFCLLAGNHAQPIVLRFIIWIASRFSEPGSESYQTLKFLLDHPRRCYLYLFPSTQTWFLLIVLCCLSAIEWSAFGILNLGLLVLQDLPIAPRVIIGLFQGIAVRASGLAIIVIVNLAPAVQFLYLVMMYIAVYPVAMCIRATNVYEEKSLGIFEAPEGDLQENLQELEVREGVGRYLGWHLRQQMAVDIWWLVWGILIITVTERGNIMNEDKPSINLFSVTFELVSAFAGIGLSLGFPTDNYSLVGTMRTLSKLVVIIIMIRGRHRGLPVAVDRAVLLPSELVTNRATSVHTNVGDTPTSPVMMNATSP